MPDASLMAPVIGIATLILVLSIWKAIHAAGLFRKTLPIRVDRSYGGRFESGLPVEMWLIFANDYSERSSLTLTIEYQGGKNLSECLSIAAGEYKHRIPEPHRVKRINVEMAGFSGLIIYV